MINHDPNDLEAELSRFQPAQLPSELRARLLAAQPNSAPENAAHSVGYRAMLLSRIFRWWPAPAAAAALALLLAGAIWFRMPTIDRPEPAVAQNRPVLRADEVQIERHLIAAYDSIASLPDGEPVRFRCWEWIDEIMVRDTAQGILIHQRIPRFEAVPVQFEIY
jgi:hypothetical protein